jgi:hypothetical protein
MRLVDTAEGPTDPLGELVSAEQSLRLDYLAFAADPLGLLAHLVGGSGRPEASPTAILQDTHSLVEKFSELGTGFRSSPYGEIDIADTGRRTATPSILELRPAFFLVTR